MNADPTIPSKPKSKLKIGLLILGALIVLGAGAYRWHVKHTVKGQAVTVERAAVRTITEVVTATGKIQPEIEVKISPEVYGEIIELPFREGARVKKGDLIVKIKPDLYQAQVDQQTAAVASARSAAIHSKATLDKASAGLSPLRRSLPRHLASDSDYSTYKTTCDTSKADYAAALANVSRPRACSSQAKDSLSKTVIYSPMDGTVSSRSCEVGERVVATGPIRRHGNHAGGRLERHGDAGRT